MSSYLPVSPDFIELVNEIPKNKEIKVFFFRGEELDDIHGSFLGVTSDIDGEFILLEGNQKLRLDRIITVDGKPGPSFPEWEAYGNSCMDCFDDEE